MGTYFDLPLNMPHAATVSRRIYVLLDSECDCDSRALAVAAQIVRLMEVHSRHEYTDAEAEGDRQDAARLGRELVDAIEAEGLGHDRLGQCVRNFFECLAMGREGAAIALRAGEDPGSLQRP
ncbi:MAG: hypothetical protein SNJ74_10195 [Fimbriimonadaceae bacterium]